jgi:glucose-6-phosphate 1-epimerase
MDIQRLTDDFAIPGVLSFSTTEHGLIRAQITTPACTAELYLQGAHLTQWQRTGHDPVLFLSDRSEFKPGKPIRGGIPVCFPWFGPRTPTPANSRTDGPSHGFARITDWTLAFAAISGDDLHLTLTLGPDENTRALGFDHFQVAYELILGAELHLKFTVANTGAEPLYIEEALHTYLHVGDVQQIAVIGLSDTEYLDKTQNYSRHLQAETPLRITKETDRPYLDTEAPVDVDDPTLRRRLTVSKTGSKTTVVWNPWSELSAKLHDMTPDGWRTMLCIETANANLNRLTIEPTAHHTMSARILAQHHANIPAEALETYPEPHV